MRQCLFICFCCMWSYLSHAQRIDFPFQWVEMPLEVKEILKEQYENKNCGAESNVYNIGVRNDVEPQNGVYWYHGMGPHFPHKVFVYYNKKVYVLKGDVEYSQDSIIQDFANSIDSLKISQTDSVTYLNSIKNALTGKNTKKVSKIKVNKKDVSQSLLEGQWFVQICKKKEGKKIKWYRYEGNARVTIDNADGFYIMSFISNAVDTRHATINRLTLKKAYYYNRKLFLYLAKRNSDHSKVSFLISKCEK